MVYEIKVADDIRQRARKTLDRMLAVTGDKSGAAISGY
jgi:quinolinate synthase